MKITHYRADASVQKQYLDFVIKKYGALNNFDYFFNDLKKALLSVPLQQDRFFIALENGNNLVGHIGLIIDSSQPAADAFWGFFECENNTDIFKTLWNELLVLAKEKNIKTLKGPINGSIWNQYRLVKQSDNSPYFKGEMFCEKYYYDFLRSTSPVELSYYSAYRDRFGGIISITELFYKKSVELGFVIEQPNRLSPSDFKAIFEMSKNVFKNNWGYVDLSEEEFFALYSPDKIASSLDSLYFLKKDDQIVGYCLCLLDNPRTVIFKTIALLPEFQGMGLANALIHKMHIDVSERGVEKVIYALIREGNDVKRLPKDDAVIFRQYSVFETIIN